MCNRSHIAFVENLLLAKPHIVFISIRRGEVTKKPGNGSITNKSLDY